MRNLRQPWVLALIVVMLLLGGIFIMRRRPKRGRKPRRQYLTNERGPISITPPISRKNSPVLKMSPGRVWNVIRMQPRIS